MRLILASASPRRSELLETAGLRFIADAVSLDETPFEGEDPQVYVRRLAVAKARAVLARHPADVVLGADTTVVVEGEILGKPVDENDAALMLRKISGRRHDVFTGIAVVSQAMELSAVEQTSVWVSELTAADIAWYVASGEPRDRAGAYAIQGLASRFIPRINGSYTNVVGLPVAAVCRLLRETGLDLIPA